MIRNNVDKQVCRLPNEYDDLLLYHTVTRFTVHQFLNYVKSMLVQECWLDTNLIFQKLNWPSAACAPPYIGITRGLWEGNCLTEHRCPLARPLGMPSGHVAHASLRGDAQIHYYLVMDFTTNNNQTISNR